MLDDVNDGTFTSSTATALAFLRTLGPRRYLHHPATGLALTTKDIGLATKDHKITDNDDSTFTIQVLSPARVWMFAPNGHKASHFRAWPPTSSWPTTCWAPRTRNDDEIVAVLGIEAAHGHIDDLGICDLAPEYLT